MGKYMRKPKTTRDVDISLSPLGVRTRARTLALERLKSSASATAGTDYLELRSRRLEKPPLLKQHLHNSRKIMAPTKQGLVCLNMENPLVEGSAPAKSPCSPIEVAVGGFSGRHNEGFEIGDLDIEASFGENNLDMEPRERCFTRESTPCSMTRAADISTTPGSSTKRKSSNASNQRAQDALTDIPTSREMDDFFTRAEQPQQRLFIEKYNFDIVNELPLPGRYEWVRVVP